VSDTKSSTRREFASPNARGKFSFSRFLGAVDPSEAFDQATAQSGEWEAGGIIHPWRKRLSLYLRQLDSLPMKRCFSPTSIRLHRGFVIRELQASSPRAPEQWTISLWRFQFQRRRRRFSMLLRRTVHPRWTMKSRIKSLGCIGPRGLQTPSEKERGRRPLRFILCPLKKVRGERIMVRLRALLKPMAQPVTRLISVR
jgi:hypothetical protein